MCAAVASRQWAAGREMLRHGAVLTEQLARIDVDALRQLGPRCLPNVAIC
eukprot:SAG11_NODE_11920_length_731_cov_1.264241_1_plen_49_part_10